MKRTPSVGLFVLLPFILFLAGFSQQVERVMLCGQFLSVRSDVMQRFLGSAKEAVGDALFIKADSYFHGGAAEHFHEDDRTQATEGAVEDHHAQDAQSQAPLDWIEWINRRVGVHEHYHLTADKKKEMLPFLAWGTALDPHNVEAVLTTAYWLDKDFYKTEDAVKILQKGLSDNPGSWEIAAALGDLYFNRRKDYVKSRDLYIFATGHFSKETGTHERARVYYFLGQSYEKCGDFFNSALMYRKALAQFSVGTKNALKTMLEDKLKQ